MTVEIKELVIRVVADGGAGSPASSTTGVDRDSVVQECVRQVLRILRRKKER